MAWKADGMIVEVLRSVRRAGAKTGSRCAPWQGRNAGAAPATV